MQKADYSFYDAEQRKGHFRINLDCLKKVKWKPSPHIEYEPSDEIWGLFFGFACYDYDTDLLMDPKGFEINQFIDGLHGRAIITNVDAPYLSCSIVFIDVEFYMPQDVSL